jgi:hypothetical protein
MKTFSPKSATAILALLAGIVCQGTGEDRLPALPDVSPVYTDEPSDTVWCGDTVLVAVTVCNFGDTIEPFDVEALIDTSGLVIYADTHTVPDLDPDSCIAVDFTNWIVPQVDGIVPCMLTVSTLLADDVNRADDTLTKSIVVWCGTYHDVLVEYIDEPSDTVWCGDISGVVSSVCNYGDTVETFAVEAVIDSGGISVYADTQAVLDLEPDSCVMVSFLDWVAPEAHLVSYTTTVAVLLAGDMDPTNDTLRKSSIDWCP